LFIWTGGGGGYVTLRVVNVTGIDLDPFALVLHFLNQFWVASKLVCRVNVTSTQTFRDC
jgi:hypothetical protein